MDNEILTKEELANFLKIGIRTVDRMMKEGLPYLKVRGSIRFERRKVLQWLEENEQK